MPTRISPLADVHPRAQLGMNVHVGPFCRLGPNVLIGDETRLDSHVTLVGHTIVGHANRFYPNAVVGTPPQDHSFRKEAQTRLVIGDRNVFREGVTVNCGAEKEDHTTRIGDGNMFMANSHVAHNCQIFNDVILVNGVLLGGHVHVHNRAIVSGNSVVHHFSTLGTLAFVSGGCRVPHDVPPYMLAAGSDNPTIKTINLVGMQRAGIPDETIQIIKRTYRFLFREHKSLQTVRRTLEQQLGGVFPLELTTLLTAIEQQRNGKMGRARERVRTQPPPDSAGTPDIDHRKAA